MNCEVVKINWGQLGSRSPHPEERSSPGKFPKQDQRKMIMRKCSGFFLSRVAISTVSLGVLKESHKTMFQPPLPNQKVMRKQYITNK